MIRALIELLAFSCAAAALTCLVVLAGVLLNDPLTWRY